MNRHRRRIAGVATLALALLATTIAALGEAGLSPFSAPEGLSAWTVTYIPGVKKRTHFNIVADDGQRVLRIAADGSAGTLVQRVTPEASSANVIRWRWKHPRHNPGTDPRAKKGDDYPVRIYLLFDYDVTKLGILDRAKLFLARRMYGDDVPAAALCYVWDPRLERGTVLPNAFTDRVRMIVVRSGSEGVGEWQSEQRELRRDFLSAFGEAAPNLSAIAVAGDADNTGDATIAFVGDITLHP